MTNSLSNSEKQLLRSLLNSHREIIRRQARLKPDLFRNLLRLPNDSEQMMSDVLQPWQNLDLTALDTAWQDLAGTVCTKGPVIRRSYIERPRGHSKTSDMAVQIAWILLAAKHPVNGLAAAADRDQANFLLESLRRLAVVNEELMSPLQFVEHLVRNRETGSRIDFISSDVKSSYGALPDFIVCDELSHWPRPEMWYSLLSSAAKKPKCVLNILTNAGVGRGWQWEIREHARKDVRWYFSSLDGPHAPWITSEWLDEQKALLPQPVFERLWLNRWQHAEGNFLTLPEVEACRNPHLISQPAGLPGVEYVAAIDYAEKHDFTVGCICHREGDITVVDRMDVVKPTPSMPTHVAWVEDWIENAAAMFGRIRFIVDEYQLVGSVQRLEQKYAIERFAFAGGEGNHRLAMMLRQLILHRRVQWYEGCGNVPGLHRDDLETELASLILKQSATGRIRIDHHSDGLHHDDRAFCLGVACLALNQTTSHDFLQITPPGFTGTFNW